MFVFARVCVYACVLTRAFVRAYMGVEISPIAAVATKYCADIYIFFYILALTFDF